MSPFTVRLDRSLQVFSWTMQAMIVEGDGDMVGDAAGYVAGDAASGAADAPPTASSGTYHETIHVLWQAHNYTLVFVLNGLIVKVYCESKGTQ